MPNSLKPKDWIFNKIHGNNLVYNTCWEDPRCDRQLLDLEADSQVVMITSAGCNALDYLLDQPATIHCVDVNPRQNALLDLKLAAIQSANYEDLYQLFGHGKHADIQSLYNNQLRASLSQPASQEYWDGHLHFFSGSGVRKSFYHYSTSGTFAWIAQQYMKAQRKLYNLVRQLFEAESLDRQAAIYYEIEKKLFTPFIEWWVNRHLAMCLVGVPSSQQKLFVAQYERGALGFIQKCLKRVFTEQSIHDNYFWRLYLHGRYSIDCRPAYLEKDNFELLKTQSRKIQLNTTTISQFLKSNPGQYSHFVLLDHQDWLAANNQAALEEEWELILQNSRPGARILLRSAAEEIDFFPDFVMNAVTFEQEKTRATHQQDRVGTYASVYLGIVK